MHREEAEKVHLTTSGRLPRSNTLSSPNERILRCVRTYHSSLQTIQARTRAHARTHTEPNASGDIVYLFVGLWWGYVLGLAVQDVCLLIFMARLDWDKEAEKVGITEGTGDIVFIIWSIALHKCYIF